MTRARTGAGTRTRERARDVTRTLLARMPLPSVDSEGDKESRGRILVIGGSTRVPGAMLLAGIAALRAGAGKLQMATVREAAMGLALAVPESLVEPLPQTAQGEIAGARAMKALQRHVEQADAVLVGPGMLAQQSARGMLPGIVDALGRNATLVLDGAAIEALQQDPRLLAPLGGRAVLTPHSGEMASLLDIDRDVIDGNPDPFARQAADTIGATVALKGATTWIAEPGGALFHFGSGAAGLGTSGSGDTLAGIVAGLAARGASPTTAVIWSVWAHGRAGHLVARRTARVGYLARELLAEIPGLLAG